MSLPALAARLGRKVYRDAKGRFTSKAKFELAKRRSLVTGQFLTGKGAALERQQGTWLTKNLGRAPAGQTWLKLADKYPENFAAWVNQMNRELA